MSPYAEASEDKGCILGGFTKYVQIIFPVGKYGVVFYNGLAA